MKLKVLAEKFRQVFDKVYDRLQANTTKAGQARLEEDLRLSAGTFESSISGAIVRDMRRSSVARVRKNSRGLPIGYGTHDAKRARLLMRSARAREAASDTHLEMAENFYRALKVCNEARRRRPRPAKMVRRMQPAWRRRSIHYIAAKVKFMLEQARASSRVPYLRTPQEIAAKASFKSRRFGASARAGA